MINRLVLHLARSMTDDRNVLLPLCCLVLVVGMAAAVATALLTPIDDNRMVAGYLVGHRLAFTPPSSEFDVARPLCMPSPASPASAPFTATIAVPGDFTCRRGTVAAVRIVRRRSLGMLLHGSLTPRRKRQSGR